MKDRIAGFHTISRRYLIDILTDIKNRNMEIGERFNKIYKKNNCDYIKSTNEFKDDVEVKRLIDELSESHPYWNIKIEILEAILRKIEGNTPENFYSLSQIKESVIHSCHESEIDGRKHFDISDEVKIEICNAEKKKFYEYINNICEEDLINAAPLFYRRALSENEISEIKRKIHAVCYKPGLEKEMTLCFKEEDLKIEIGSDEIINILRQQETSQIYEINTGGIGTASYIMDLSVFDPYYIDGFDIYWCTEQLDWVIIKDHEGYYYFYGEWLINEIKKAWREWEESVL
ncbi:hypothetical protein [Lutispora saccharofermentans]|uniref:Uncharacterized protein n=1 Tax=Lutispora saccharofermentans TaxID=3024236 RepID=A0ABT1NK42_9FIRM|nr:hypothetical protein [Lutispora saccharofermentans]MCQ1531613.1 hypothetical protein [Lutispora saccharofermentans]